MRKFKYDIKILILFYLFKLSIYKNIIFQRVIKRNVYPSDFLFILSHILKTNAENFCIIKLYSSPFICIGLINFKYE